MVQEVERINRSVTQLLEFAKPVAVDKKEVEIREMISHSLKLMAHDLEKKSIAVHTDIQSVRSTCYTDPDRMNQILLNLYMNSLAAMAEGGRLTVTVKDLGPEQDLEIQVTDDGCGMDEQVLSEIFDPYFTTRPDGTGLGLSIVHRLVETLGGDIRVESGKGQGTTFLSGCSLRQRKIPMRHKILVVEDDPAHARMLKTLISDWGYEVMLADDGDTGVEQVNPGG